LGGYTFMLLQEVGEEKLRFERLNQGLGRQRARDGHRSKDGKECIEMNNHLQI